MPGIFDMNIYLPKEKGGWINIPAIEKAAPKAFLFVLVGSRRVGKTYGVIDYLHELKRHYIYMRLTAEELDYSLSGTVDFYAGNGFPWAGEMRITDGKPRCIYDSRIDDGATPVAKAMALSDVSKIRGFGAQDCTDIVLDEFIPEISAYNKPHAGAALKNAYITINGVRELKGQPPCRLWLLANSNSLDNDILREWHLIQPLMRMQAKGENYYYNEKRRLCIVNVNNSNVSERLAQTAFFQCVGVDDELAQMALKNAFIGQDNSGVGSCPLAEYTPAAVVDNMIFYQHKSRANTWYIVQLQQGQQVKTRRVYSTDNPTKKAEFLRWWKLCGNVIPVDGKTLFYCTYEVKMQVHKLLNFK